MPIFQYISNKMQRYTVYFIWKLLYMFRVVPPTIIRNPNNCIYSIWYLSHRYCYLPLSWKCWNWFECAVGGVLICFGFDMVAKTDQYATHSTLKPGPTLPRQQQIAITDMHIIHYSIAHITLFYRTYYIILQNILHYSLEHITLFYRTYYLILQNILHYSIEHIALFYEAYYIILQNILHYSIERITLFYRTYCIIP